MSREIKFRIWNVTGSCMHEWRELVEKNKIHLLANQQPAYPVMQFTGLKDANGVDVYDGDIIRDEEGYLSKIYWHERDFMWGVSEIGGLCELTGSVFVVIGNIHQNPELLK